VRPHLATALAAALSQAWRLAGLAARCRGRDGQGMVEYAFILLLVALVVIAALLAVGGQMNVIFNNVVSKLKSP
jgi:pilus assembly protein Flp/PilA